MRCRADDHFRQCTAGGHQIITAPIGQGAESEYIRRSPREHSGPRLFAVEVPAELVLLAVLAEKDEAALLRHPRDSRARVFSAEAVDGCNGADATAYGGVGNGGIRGHGSAPGTGARGAEGVAGPGGRLRRGAAG